MTDRLRNKQRDAVDRPADQSRKFIRTARELGCDEDPEAFRRAVRKLAEAPPAPRPKSKKDIDKPS